MNSLTTLDFLSHLRSIGISLRAEAGQLHVSAPKESITPELRTYIARRKPELLDVLTGSGAGSSRGLTVTPVPRDAELPLSFAQQRLWFLDQLDPQSAAYAISMAARITGQLDLPVLERTLSEIVRRHEILRTVFPATSGSPRQVILPPAPITLEVIDLSQGAETGRESAAHEFVAGDARNPFDLVAGPLFRPHLLRLGERDHILVITVHHTVFDGWSMAVLWREFGLLYEAYRSGLPSPLPELPVQYADFAVWQKRLLEGPARDSHMAYWRSRLQGKLPALELPIDHSRQDQSPRGARERVRLDPAVADALRSMGQQEGSSLFMILLAAFQVLLFRITGQNDILVGTPIAGRNRTELEALIGFFVNTIVMRGQLSGDLPFREYLASVRNTVLDAHAHQDLPFEELVAALDAKRDLKRSPLFQVFYNHLNLHPTLTRVRGLQIEPFGEFEVESKFDLTLYSCEQGKSIDLLLLYNSNLFDKPRMTLLLEQFAGLLKQIAQNPSRSLDDYSLVTSSGAQLLPDPTARLDIRWPTSVPARFLEHAARNRERAAVEDSDGTWTYGELARLTSGLAARLQHAGVERGDTVVVLAHRSAPLVLALMGVLRAGAAFCILNPDYPGARLANCIRRVKPKAWIQIAAAGEPPQEVLSALREFAQDRCIALPRTGQVPFMRELAANLASEVELEPDDPAYLTFTSGTTAEPKCILGTHRPVSHFLDWHSREFELTETDRFSVLSGLAHDPLLRDVFTPLWVGATVCIPPSEEILAPGRLARWMERHKITVAHLTPALGALLGLANGRFESTPSLLGLRYAFFGGDVLLPRNVEMIRAVAPRVECVNLYGATETPQAMAFYRIRNSDEAGSGSARSFPLGCGISDAQLVILNRARKLAGPGELGEIYVRTPYLSMGYVDDDSLTQQRFLVNPFTNAPGDRLYRTGDLGRYRPDGMVEFAGRSDEQVKIRGYRVEPAEVEGALAACPGVRGAAVVARPDPAGGNQLVAYVTSSDGRSLATGEVRDFLRKSLPDHLLPSVLVAVDRLPLTPNGKIDRGALRLLEPDQPKTRTESVAPTGKVERMIAEIWSDVLNTGSVGLFDNFFDLGGHSLSAARLIARLRSAFQIDFPLRSIFQDPTIAGFASRIRYDASTDTYQYLAQEHRWKCLVPAQPRGSRIPLFLVAGYQGPDDTFLVLSHIIPHLGQDQPVYGFKPRWVDGDQDYSSVDEVVQDFLTELRMVQPKGPYALGGYCVGGVVALEMARRLIEEGEEVGLLALVDTERPGWTRAFLADSRLAWRRGRHMLAVISEILLAKQGPPWRAALELIRRKTGTRSAPDAQADSTDFYRSKIGYRRLVYGHPIKSYPGRITLFVNGNQCGIDRHMGWRRFAKGGVTVKKVPGDHLTMVTDYAKDFGEVLSACLDSVGRAADSTDGRGAR